MQFTDELNDFNRELAEELQSTFAVGVRPVQGEDGALRFRGPVQSGDDPTHVGTHVTVSISAEVKEALAKAEPQRRAEITKTLIRSLGSQVRAKYDAEKVGPFSLQFSGETPLLQD